MSAPGLWAERVLILTANFLPSFSPADASFETWVATLADVLPDCAPIGGDPSITPLKAAAERLVEAKTQNEKTAALSGLRVACGHYSQARAAHYFDAWRHSRAKDVI